MNWNANLLPVRVSGKCGALLSDILDGMRWAAGLSVEGVPNNANPAKVINLSFGGDQACTASYQTVIDELAAVGTLVVVAAGNGQGTQSRQLRRPADCRGVMAVGAVQRDGAKTDYSFVGSNMALMAPGGHAISSNNPANTTTLLFSSDNAGLTSPTPGAGYTYGYKAGTSFSAPLAAGVASLMLAINPNLSPDALIARMKSSALPHASSGGYFSCSASSIVACNCTTALCGAGMLNPLGAVQDAVKPAAVIAAVGNPGLGATVVLDGRASAAVGTPTIASYAWSQVSGAAVSIPNASASLTQVILPNAAGSFVFKLRVTDSLSQIGEAQLYIQLEAPVAALNDESSGGGSGSGGGGGGGGADRALLVLLTLLVCGLFLRRFLSQIRL
jgi:serine protease